jgi:hypothetical protein
MRAIESMRKVVARLAGILADMARGPKFACGDCERNARCGLAPSDLCAVRAEQIARDGDRRFRRRTLTPN